MKDELLNIINNSDEPVYEIDAYLDKLKANKNQVDKAWNEILEIAVEGDIKQRFVALTIISIDKPNYIEKLSFELIKNRNFSNIEPILKPIITICSIIGKEAHANFMLEVFDYARINKNEYLWEVTLRNIISTKYWKRIISEIIDVVSNSDKNTIVNLLAYLIHKQGKAEFDYLMSCLPNSQLEKVKAVHNDISKRLRENYQKVKKDK